MLFGDILKDCFLIYKIHYVHIHPSLAESQSRSVFREKTVKEVWSGWSMVWGGGPESDSLPFTLYRVWMRYIGMGIRLPQDGGVFQT